MPRIMQRIEQSAHAKHLVYAEDIFSDYATEADFTSKYGVTAKTFYCFYTNSPCFETKKSLNKSGVRIIIPRLYELKDGVSLSDALEDILTKSTTVIDCLQAINIAWCLCIEALLIECYGNVEGKNKFNQLFNHKAQPFQLSAFDVNQMTGNSGRSAYAINVPVLSYFMQNLPTSVQCYYTAKSDPRLMPGTRLTIYNVPEYKSKHIIGNAGAINLMCIDHDTYMGFGLGKHAVTEAEVNTWLKNCHEKTRPLEQRIPWVQCIADAKRTPDYASKNIYPAGYIADNSVQLSLNKLEHLTEENGFKKTLDNVQIFMHEYSEKQFFLLHQESDVSTSQLSLSARTRLLLAAEDAKANHAPSGKDILFLLTQKTFNYSEKMQVYWMLNQTAEEAESVVALLNHPALASKVSRGKIAAVEKYPNMHYRVVVEAFDPLLISLNSDGVRLGF